MREYVVRHVTRYTYEEEVTESYGRAYLTPRDDMGQRLRDHVIEVIPGAALLSSELDYYGNVTSYSEVLTPHKTFEVSAVSQVAVDRPKYELGAIHTPVAMAAAAARSMPWSARESLWVKDFTLPTRHVPRDSITDAYAELILDPGAAVGAAVLELVHRVHSDLAYRPGTTSVRTTPAQALEQKQGVCQDFAHVMLACLRWAGLPARYVSGYLETLPPPGQPKRTGADASHAWVGVWLPELGWVDLDPTNDQLVDDGYVALAWGRDYADVAPLRGVVYSEGATTSLEVAVDVLRRDVPAVGQQPALDE